MVGRLATRGRVPLGYYKDPERSARTFVEIDGARWSLPGDMATIDADGTVHLLGRGSLCINTGGEKVYPEEVEAVLKVGAGGRRRGRRRRRPTSASASASSRSSRPPTKRRAPDLAVLQAHCRAQLAGYKVPRALHVVDDDPRATTRARSTTPGPAPSPRPRHVGQSNQVHCQGVIVSNGPAKVTPSRDAFDRCERGRGHVRLFVEPGDRDALVAGFPRVRVRLLAGQERPTTGDARCVHERGFVLCGIARTCVFDDDVDPAVRSERHRFGADQHAGRGDAVDDPERARQQRATVLMETSDLPERTAVFDRTRATSPRPDPSSRNR